MDGDETDRHPPVRRTSAFLFRLLGFVSLGLAAVGIVLPGLPATPFLLLAVWAFARGAPHLVEAIEKDPRFGPLLKNWRERRAVPMRAKLLAFASMAFSFALLVASGASPLVLWIVGSILVAVAIFLGSRPSR